MYHNVFVAGTFDGIHKGHEALLAKAFTEGERVTVGITPDAFAKTYKTRPVAPFDQRKTALEAWLAAKGWGKKATIIGIQDQYEPAASDPGIDAIIVTKENRVNGEAINVRRVARGLTPLTLIDVPIVSAEDGKPISSTRVHEGEIDETGKLTMPEALRQELGKPLGRLVAGPAIVDTIAKEQGRTVITVGDVVTKTFLSAGVTPNLAIIDLRIGRKPDATLGEFGRLGRHIKSGPGFISRAAIAAIGTWAEATQGSALHKEVIVIDGEEDLLVLPVILAAPLESLVYYGQPPLRPSGYEGQANQGIVEVEVTIEKKKEMMELLKKFEEK